MFLSFKKILLNSIFNITLFVFLILSIQNSSTKNRVYLFDSKTIKLPVSFIIGTSFLAGSIVGSIFPLGTNQEK